MMTLTQASASDDRGSDFMPADEEARRRIQHDLGMTLFVEASAGTGKTTSLVQRVTNLVAAGVTTLDRIAAITFTEAAAAELRDRIRADLESASIDEQRDQLERDRCLQGVADLDRADICTLHSFAGGLLRERPLEAGLPPSFEISDEILAGIRFDEEWNGWLDRHLDGDTDLAPHLAMAFALGLTLNHLRTIARAFHQNYSDLLHVSFNVPDSMPPGCPGCNAQRGGRIGKALRLFQNRPGRPAVRPRDGQAGPTAQRARNRHRIGGQPAPAAGRVAITSKSGPPGRLER